MKKFIFCLLATLLTVAVNATLPSYIIGRDSTWFPLDLREKNANVNLFINALFEKINKEGEESFTIIEVSTLSLMQGLTQKKYDAILTTLSPRSDISHQFAFSDPLILLGPVLVVPKHANAQSLSDLCGQLLGVYTFDNSVDIIQKYPSILMKQYENMPLALQDLAQGSLDGVIMDILAAKSIISNLYPNTLRIATPTLNDHGIRLITLKNEQISIICSLNTQLKNIFNNFLYDELFIYSELTQIP